MAVLVYRTALGCAGNCGAAVRVCAWLRAQRRPGLARLCARPLSAPQETIRRDVSGRCVRGALVFYLKAIRVPVSVPVPARGQPGLGFGLRAPSFDLEMPVCITVLLPVLILQSVL
jgi:hypothetical protein